MHYAKNYLTNVVCRIDLTGAKELGGLTRPAMSEEIGATYPQFVAKPTAKLSFNLSLQGTQVNQQIVSFAYEHRNAEKPSPVIVLGEDLISIEYGEHTYDHFPPLRAVVEWLVQTLGKHHPDAAVARLGLRYINEIKFDEGNALDWATIIRGDLITSVKAGILPDMRVARSMHQLQQFNDDATVLIHYGLTNPDFPNELVRRVFVVDIDASRNGPITLQETVACVTSLNAVCETVFEGCIDDGLRQTLGVVNG